MMNYSPQSYEALRREVTVKIEDKLSSVGILFRIFSRIKTPESTGGKLAVKSYHLSKNKMQDFVGVRVTVYFEEDIFNVEKVLCSVFSLNSSSKTSVDNATFSPKNFNLVFNLSSKIPNNPDSELIDDTFEVQIRTIFSEGWHEIEHDLRYKNREQWDKHPEQSRGLNAIHATLEMCDWGMTKLSDEMAYNAYKSKDLHSLITNKLKLRLKQSELSDVFIRNSKENEFLKNILRSNRNELIEFLSGLSPSVPLTVNNVLWVLSVQQSIVDFDRKDIPVPLQSYLISVE
jgi:putative GTP pyrophosphokinase